MAMTARLFLPAAHSSAACRESAHPFYPYTIALQKQKTFCTRESRTFVRSGCGCGCVCCVGCRPLQSKTRTPLPHLPHSFDDAMTSETGLLPVARTNIMRHRGVVWITGVQQLGSLEASHDRLTHSHLLCGSAGALPSRFKQFLTTRSNATTTDRRKLSAASKAKVETERAEAISASQKVRWLTAQSPASSGCCRGHFLSLRSFGMVVVLQATL